MYSQKSSTVFVDNIPHQTRKLWVYNLFSRFGKIRDIYIPNKKSKITGQDFGFVRFYRVTDAEGAITEVNNSWHWGHKLMVKFASFLRKIDKQETFRSFNNKGKFIPNLSRNIESKQYSHIQPHTHKLERGNFIWRQKEIVKSRDQKRGREVWRRKGLVESSEQGRQRNINNERHLVSNNFRYAGSINVQPTGNGFLYRSAVAKIKKLVSCKDLELVFSKNGVKEIQIKAIGGRYIIIIFHNKEYRDSVIKQAWLRNWFEDINPWNGEQASEERFVWLSCFGMPINAWSFPTFKDIGNTWGQFLMVDESTLNQNYFVKASILIATNQVQKIGGHVELVVDKVKYKVRIVEEGSFRSIDNSLFNVSSELALEMNSAQEEDDVETPINEVDKNSEVVANNGAQEVEREKQTDVEANVVVTSPINSQMECVQVNVNEMAAALESLNSSLGIEDSTMGCERIWRSPNSDQSLNEKVMDSFGDSQDASKNNALVMKESKNVALMDKELTKECFKDDEPVLSSNELDTRTSSLGTGSSVMGGKKDLDSFGGNEISAKVLDLNQNEINNDGPHSDLFEENHNPIQAAVKGVKGKKKRKNIYEILGFSKVNKCNRKGGRNKNKCVVLRSAVAAAALSASVSSNGINNRNRILLNKAQTIWEINKLIGIGYDGDEEEVISRIAEIEAQDEERADCLL